MLIDLTSIAAEVKADEQSIKVTTDENIDREGGDLDLTLTWWRGVEEEEEYSKATIEERTEKLTLIEIRKTKRYYNVANHRATMSV